MASGAEHVEEFEGKKIFVYPQATSTFDIGFGLAEKGILKVGGSVLAKSQTAGTGQLMRPWFSPEGNLYACLSLPDDDFFNSSGAAIIVGYICAWALNNLGFKVLIKWPNDLVLAINDVPAKVGGILLKERGGVMLAGIGINVTSCPAHLRDKAALPATYLEAAGKAHKNFSPLNLWKLMLHYFYEALDKPGFMENWNMRANDLLLWRNRPVIIEDGDEKAAGVFLDLAKSGGAILEREGRLEEFFAGSMRLGA